MEQNCNNNTKLDLIENKYTSQITAMDILSKKSETKDYQSNLKFNIDCKICTAAFMKNCLKKYDQIFLSNKITIEGSQFICMLCKRRFPSLHDVLLHINGKVHINKIKCQDQNSNICRTKYTMCTNFDNDGSANQKPTINFSKNKMNVSVNEKCSLNNNICNTICSMNPLLNNKFKQEHLINLEEKVKTNEIQNNSNNTNALNKFLYFCELCSIQIDIKNLYEHINTVIHKCNIPAVSIGDDMFLFKCFCCKSIIQGTISLITHLNSTKHLNNLKNTLIHVNTNNTEIFLQSPDDTQNILEDTKSALCSVLFPKIGNVSMYLSEKCIISFDTSNIVLCDNIKNKIIYYCLICRVTLNTTHNLIEHCRARMHLWRIKQLPSKTLNYSSKILKCSSNEMGKEQIITTTDNCFGITSNINAQITELLHASPFKSNLTKKHNHERQRIVTRLNKIYCEKYLEIEEKMYTLDKKKLNNIELNFKPFMPYNRKNFYCLACNDTVSKELDLLYEHACCDPHKINLNIIKEDTDSEKLIKQYMQKISEDSIKCHICRSCIKNDTNNIDAHINNKMHKKRHKTFCAVIDNAFNSITQNLSNLWYSIQKFSCVPCAKSFNYKMEFIEHITTHAIHSTKEIFDFCIPCATLWLDIKDCYTEHCNDAVHKYLIKSKDFMVEDLPECIKKLLEQVDKISDILFEQTQILMNDTIHKEVAQSLENTLKSFCPSIKAFLFGSRITGLGFVNSDIDIYLDCGNTYYQGQEECLRKKYFRSIEKILHEQKKEWEVKEVQEESRTPVIKLLHKRTNTQCDISIKNGISVENSKLIRSFNDAYLPCRKLILFIKKWLSCFNLPSGHGLKNYAIAWIVIFYLQLNLHLPSVATLIKEKNKSRLICGWETGVAQPTNNNKSQQSLSMLLLGFFQFYANFDYRNYIICPLMGYALAKKDFIKLDILPKEMNPYINHVNESKNPEYFRIDSPLCVQDPFDLSHNLTKAVSSITLKYFKQYCQDSASILSSKTK